MSDLDYPQARLAYTIIETLLAHVEATQDLVAVMAQALDEDTKVALTNTPPWTSYLESRRRMKNIEGDVEVFAEMMAKLSIEE